MGLCNNLFRRSLVDAGNGDIKRNGQCETARVIWLHAHIGDDDDCIILYLVGRSPCHMDHRILETGRVSGGEQLFRICGIALAAKRLWSASCRSSKPSSLLTLPARPPIAVTFVL